MLFVIEGPFVSLIVPVQDTTDKFIISIGRNLAIVTWDGESSEVSNVEVIAEVDKEGDAQQNRLNDGKADPHGRLWAGNFFQFWKKN